MGLLVRQHRDPDVTPEISTNAGGRFHWSGLHESVLAACDVVLILDFCRSEGRNMGWNGTQAPADTYRSNCRP